MGVASSVQRSPLSVSAVLHGAEAGNEFAWQHAALPDRLPALEARLAELKAAGHLDTPEGVEAQRFHAFLLTLRQQHSDQPAQILDGNAAAAHVGYLLSDKCLVYLPQQTTVAYPGQHAQVCALIGLTNHAGQPTPVLEVPYGQSAGDIQAAVDADPGAVVAAFVHSDRLVGMIPALFQLVASGAKAVLHVALATPSAHHHNLVTPDLAGVMAARDTGCVLLASSTAQECHDMAVVAQAVAAACSTPVIHFYDGVRAANQITKVQPLPVDALRACTAAAAAAAAEGSPDDALAAARGVMAALSQSVGRRYSPFEFVGAPDATAVVVLAGPGASTAQRVARNLVGQGHRLAVLTLRILRPWDSAALVAALPPSVERICVVDSWSEAVAGDPGTGPLFQDVVAAFYARHRPTPPAMANALLHHSDKGLSLSQACALFSALVDPAAPAATTTFVLDGETPSHLGVGRLVSPAIQQAEFWSKDAGVAGTLGSIQTVLDVFALQLSLNVQGFASRDTRSAGSVTRFQLRFGPGAIEAEHGIEAADYVACHDAALLLMPQYRLLQSLAQGGALLINCPWADDAEVGMELPDAAKRDIAHRGATLYVVDASTIADRHDVAEKLDSLLQAAFFTWCGGVVSSWAIAALKKGVAELYGPDFQARHAAAIAETAAGFRQVAYDAAAWRALPETPVSPSKRRATALFAPLAMAPAALAAAAPGHGGGAGPASSGGAAPGGGAPDTADGDARASVALLTQLFGERMVLADATGTDSLFGAKFTPSGRHAADVGSVFADKPEFCFGVYLARLLKRNQLVDAVGRALEGRALPDGPLRAALAGWLAHRDDADESQELGERAAALLEAMGSLPGALHEVHALRSHFVKRSRWIIGSDSWACDIGYSGLHHIMASGEDVNVLILETGHYTRPSVEARTSGRTKKDIGLYAMNYGGVYVASVALSGPQTQAVRALGEADRFHGPSIVLAYAPRFRGAQAARHAADEARAATEQGLWPLYRWNPRAAEPFALDSRKLRADLEAFLKRQTDLSLLVTADPSLPPQMDASSQRRLLDAQQRLRAQHGGGGGNLDIPLLVLYGSDGGNAGGLAEKFAKKAEMRGVSEVRCQDANSFDPAALPDEPNVVFVLATAGQGEMAGNAKSFWSGLAKLKARLAGTRYAVFGLGDSAYWGKGTADSAKYFCLPAKELDVRLDELGAQRIGGLGLGDDQAANGYAEAWSEWAPAVFEALGVRPVKGEREAKPKAMVDESLKHESNYLRGHILRSLADESTGKILPEDTKLTKFHGIYQQDDRDVREALQEKGLERAYSFMVRVGIPGGVCTPEQWLAMDTLGKTHGNGTLKLTTRQAFQLHNVLKGRLKHSIQEINRALMDTLAACGDVCRNVIASPNPHQSEVHTQVLDFARKISAHLKPQTTAYHEIWLDKKRVGGNANADVEPLYGQSYLPRKFKVAIAVPPMNDVDVFAHCLGLIAVVQDKRLVGFNVSIGGGMGMTHGNTKTYPRLGDLLGFCTVEQAIRVGEAVMLVQRDHGDRYNRKHARLKYTLEDHGMEWYRAKVEAHCGFKVGKPRPFRFENNGDRYGWDQGYDGAWTYGMFVEGGRVRDEGEYQLKTGLREIAKVLRGDFRLTANQNVLLGGITPEQKPEIEALLRRYHIENKQHSSLRLNSIACASLPYCALAMAEAERYLPSLVDKLDVSLAKHGLMDEPITIRMSGCPNGCARPYVAEIFMVGKAPGVYNLYLGGGHAGNRLGKVYKEGVNEKQMLDALDPLFADYAKQRLKGERFGDFVVRKGVVQPTLAGRLFHATSPEENKVPTYSGTTDIYW